MNIINHALSRIKSCLWLQLLLSFFVMLLLSIIILTCTEGWTIWQSFWWTIVTSTTTGFGGLIPTSLIGQIWAVFVMLFAVVLVAAMLGATVEALVEFKKNKRKGMITSKIASDLIIIGYPSEEKVKAIIREMQLNIPDAKMVCVTNQIEDKPHWMSDANVSFIYGRASVREVLERANVMETKHILVLANDPADITSDEYSSSAVMMCEAMNPEAHTIAEKVRPDEELFKWANCDKIVDVCRANELVQEVLSPGAIDLVDTIFSAESPEVQKNIKTPFPTGGVWFNVVVELAKVSVVAMGYSIDGGNTFKFVPERDTFIPKNAIIKVITTN